MIETFFNVPAIFALAKHLLYYIQQLEGKEQPTGQGGDPGIIVVVLFVLLAPAPILHREENTNCIFYIYITFYINIISPSPLQSVV